MTGPSSGQERIWPRRARLLIENLLRYRLPLRARIKLLQYVIVLGRDVAMLQLEKRCVRTQIHAAPLRGSCGLVVPQSLQMPRSNFRLRMAQK